MEDAVTVVGSGPNGLSAAIAVAEAGHRVVVYEGSATWGGALRSAELTLPGYIHDTCSAIHPLAVASPAFRRLPLGALGVEWVQPDLPLAHPFDDGTAAVLDRSPAATGESFGSSEDARAWRGLFEPIVRGWGELIGEVLAPLHLPRRPLLLARFGWKGLRSAVGLARGRFGGERARGLFAGLAAHSMLPLDSAGSAAFGILLGAAGHAVGWPLPRGGSQRVSDALVAHLESLGGTVHTGRWIASTRDLPASPAVLLDVTPRQLARLAEDELPRGYRDALLAYRYGPGAFKVDWALSAPIPWRAEACRRAGTVHLGGSLEEIAASERAPWNGEHAERPFVLLAQQSVFDSTRAPPGKHTAWAYCHVPNGSDTDMAARIEAQVERFAPGFRETMLARAVRSATGLERHNPNCVGGDINGGAADLRQLVFRPAMRWNPYATPNPRLFICSSSTPPGGGVHGMCGFHAARAALRRLARR